METNLGPSVADLERVERFKVWRNSYFAIAAAAMGARESAGAQRSFGDFEFACDSVDYGVVAVWAATRPNMPLVATSTLHVKWEAVSAEDAAAAMLAEVDHVRRNPIFVITKRAERSAGQNR